MKIKIKMHWVYRTANISRSVKIPANFMPLVAEVLNNHETAIIRIIDQYNRSSVIAAQHSDGYLYIGKPDDVVEQKW